MLLCELDSWFRSFLEIDNLARIDSSLNGVQVGDLDAEVKRIAFAVDASLETFRRAVEQGADLLTVHHGIYWGSVYPITGVAYRRMQFLLRNGLSLYAVHLPLDRHPELGNNAGIARALGLESVEPFGTYKGVDIGCRGVFPRTRSLDDVVTALPGDAGEIHVLPFGKSDIRSVGIVSGGAPRDVEQAIAEGLDLYITGDRSHSVYHLCMEAGINVIFGGHYLTEIWGVKLLAEKAERELPVSSIFIDLPTGL